MLKAGFRYGDSAPVAVIEFVERDTEAKGADDRARREAEKARGGGRRAAQAGARTSRALAIMKKAAPRAAFALASRRGFVRVRDPLPGCARCRAGGVSCESAA